ncbi:ATP-binding protein [Kitasatospora sp. NPDC006697]|uniref:ATP-binding protein n=1 Tax=Kitasatospora sp. NPDC006697 TaxID=3364020 RepID=UPI0036954BEB
MDDFLGRDDELQQLSRILQRVREGGRAGRPGRALLMRGRRRVGKSRLAEEFIEQARVPYLFFTASAQPSADEDLRLFTEAAAGSTLPGAAIFQQQAPRSWDAALTLLANALPADGPAVVVIDELPYLIANDPGFEGTLQKLFDREFARREVLLIGIGSDLAMMEALNEYGRPFHQRATEMVVAPLSPAAVGGILRLPAAEAFDAYLVSGGLPLILEEWPTGATVHEYLADAVRDPTSALLVSAERSLAAEFPAEVQARQVLTAVGSGERTFSMIGRAAGGLAAGSLNRSLKILADKRIVSVAAPLSTRPARESRYQVSDPHLRFWLRFLGPHLPEIERRRGDLVLDRIERDWTAWRGRAIEPVVREALLRLGPDVLPEGTGAVGGYWTRTNDVEIDLVAADRAPVAGRVTAVGSIKWLERRPFDSHDLAELMVHRSRLPGAESDTPLIAVTRSGCTAQEVRRVGPEELIAAWQAR